MRTVLHWVVATSEAGAGLRLAAGLWRFWWLRGLWTEGRRWCGQLLALAPTAPADPELVDSWLDAMSGAGLLAGFQGAYAAARAIHEPVLAAARQRGDQRRMAASLSNLAFVADMEGAYDEAEQRYRESLTLVEQLGDARLRRSLVGNLGMVCHVQGKLAQAWAYYAESLRLAQQQGSPPA